MRSLSAAPAAVAQHASAMVLRDSGYAMARAATNGFTCLVEHENLRAIEPVCYDAVGSASTLQASLFLARRRAAGVPDSIIQIEMEAAYRDGSLRRTPAGPGVAYMLSPRASMPPHVMFYAPYATREALGMPGPGGAPQGMPFLYNAGRPNAYIIVMAPR